MVFGVNCLMLRVRNFWASCNSCHDMYTRHQDEDSSG
jgi:hypothetical protein